MPHGNLKILTALSLILLAVSALPVSAATSSTVTTPTVTKFSLPVGSSPIALAHDSSGDIVYGSATKGEVYIVNPSTSTVEYVAPPSSGGPFGWTSITFHQGTVLAMNNGSGSFTGGVWEFRESSLSLVSGNNYTASWSKLDIAESCGAGCFAPAPVGGGLTQTLFSPRATCNCTPSQFIYAAQGSTFWKIGNESVLTNSSIPNGWGASSICGGAFPAQNVGPKYPVCYYAFPYNIPANWGFTPSGRGNFEGVTNDTKGDVLLTDRADGVLMVYNATNNSEAHYTGFTKPTGVAVVGKYAYVSSDVSGGGIANFSLHSGSTIGTIPTTGGTPFSVTDYGGKVVWDSNATDGHVCQVGPTVLTTYCTTTGQSNYYLASTSSAVYFGYFDPGVGEIVGLGATTSAGGGSSSAPSCTNGVETGNLGTPTPQFQSVKVSGGTVTVTGFLWLIAGSTSALKSFNVTTGGYTYAVPVSARGSKSWDGFPVVYWNFTATVALSQGSNLLSFSDVGTRPYIFYDCASQAQAFTFTASLGVTDG